MSPCIPVIPVDPFIPVEEGPPGQAGTGIAAARPAVPGGREIRLSTG
jgi:hypothetical protein